MTMEYKTAPLITQSISDRTVTGLAAIFGNVDDGGDMLHPGAFSKTINERKSRVRHLWQHDASQPPTAKVVSLQEVGREQLPPDLLVDFPQAKGGLMVTREYLDTPRGNETLQGIRAGAIGEMSFGYDAIKKDFTTAEGKSVRNLREVRLYETSDVMWGMNPATRAAKALADGDVDELIHSMDRMAQAVLVEVKVGRMISASNMASLKRIMSAMEDGLEELETLLGAAEPPEEEAAETAKSSPALTVVNVQALMAQIALREREFQTVKGLGR
jgi:hypothetical protein